MFARPPQQKVDADELDPAELDDGHERGLHAEGWGGTAGVQCEGQG